MEWLLRFIRTRWAWALVLPPLLFFLAFFVGPLLYLFFVSLHDVSQAEMYGTRLTMENYVRIAGDPFYHFIIRRTLTAGPTPGSRSDRGSATSTSAGREPMRGGQRC